MIEKLNYGRWEDFGKLKKQSVDWRRRNEIIGEVIIKEFVTLKDNYRPTILDIGCCDMFLESYLNNRNFKFEYIPCDLYKRDERTLVIDLNKKIEYLPYVDYCIFSGVLEYLLDLEYVLKEAKKYSKNIIFSYSVKTQSIEQRALNDWVNHYTELEITQKVSKYGSLSKLKEIFNDQIIFKLE